MNNLSRRDFGKIALGTVGGLAASVTPLSGKKAASSVFGGVQIGVQSYSFRDRSLGEALDALVNIGISSMEIWGSDRHLDPLKATDEELKSWRRKFADAGVRIGAYNVSPHDNWTDEQIDRGFQAAKLIGADVITSSVSKKTVPRLDKACQKLKMKLGLHNHWFNHARPDQFESPEDFHDALKDSSPWINVNLDVGHFHASGYDPVRFIEEHHDRIVSLHLKDRGDDPKHTDRPFGEAHTPLVLVAQLLKKLRFKYAANIEWEVENVDPVKGIADALEYLKKALA